MTEILFFAVSSNGTKKRLLKISMTGFPLCPLFACFLFDLLLPLLGRLVFLDQIVVKFKLRLEVRLPDVFLEVLDICQLWEKILMFS